MDVAGQKQYVRDLFDSIAHRYDLLNHLLSGGMDFYWRRRAVKHLSDLHPKRVLDVATGTGDFAIAALTVSPEQVTGVDIAGHMLEVGRDKLRRKGLDHRIQLHNGEAEHLEFPDDAFDAAMVAFGARNFENLEKGLREMQRVVRPGGRIIVLEFSKPVSFPFRQIYFFYFTRLLPLIGKVISGNPAAYRYLPDSVLQFPEGNDFLRILESAGFMRTLQERISFGIATIYTGTKPTTGATGRPELDRPTGAPT